MRAGSCSQLSGSRSELFPSFCRCSQLSSREGASPVLRSAGLPDAMDPAGELHRNGMRRQKGPGIKKLTVSNFTENFIKFKLMLIEKDNSRQS